MKQKDIAIIIIVVAISGVISFFVGRLFFAPASDRQEKVEVVDALSTDFPVADNRYFNAQATNPTQLIRISENTNTAPFSAQ